MRATSAAMRGSDVVVVGPLPRWHRPRPPAADAPRRPAADLGAHAEPLVIVRTSGTMITRPRARERAPRRVGERRCTVVRSCSSSRMVGTSPAPRSRRVWSSRFCTASAMRATPRS
jgi:hypothetical protein